ncbi:hypothetical protein ACQKWADRAFT_307392 [Trichoderma austrokoningii]
MAGCVTCRQRKVKCDGRSGLCRRCEKLGIQCLWTGSPLSPQSTDSATRAANLTQAGHKRLRIPVACETCRKKKLKCGAQKPACSFCVRKQSQCIYVTAGRRWGELDSEISPGLGYAPLESSEQAAELPRNSTLSYDTAEAGETTFLSSHAAEEQLSRSPGRVSQSDVSASERGPERRANETSVNSAHSPRLAPSEPQMRMLGIPSGQELLPYLDSLLENVHPISCNNFLHPGYLCEGLGRAPALLLLAICASSSKFLPGSSSRGNGLKWAAEARSLITSNFDHISTLTISAVQFLVLHEMHEGEYTSAWNLVGIATRMSMQLKLYEPSSQGTFLQQECRRRLMWAVLVSDLLFESNSHIDLELLMDVPLPCNLWSFTQGQPCQTLTLRQLRGVVEDDAIKQSSNHCAYLINILAIRRKILTYMQEARDSKMDLPWLPGSHFSLLCEELEIWRRNLPANYAFVERHMYTFRISRHLDIFLMIHAYYHQCCIILFGAFVPEDVGSKLQRSVVQIPPEFIQTCSDQYVSHARDISFLIQKVLKVEPDHLFRDPWLGLCIWDSTSALLASTRWQENRNSYRNDITELVKLNLRALENSMSIIVLAKKIHGFCCADARAYGIDISKGLSVEDMERAPFEPGPFNAADGISRRYPFLSPMKTRDSPEWDQLFHATNVGNYAAPTRPSASTPSRPLHSIPRPGSSIFQPNQTLSVTEELSYLNTPSMPMLASWPMDDLQWWQIQDPDMDPAAAAAITGLVPSIPAD